jgi:signal transduction histidine kinase
MLGNLLENACKWARHAVTVQITVQGQSVRIDVGDDGPGLAESHRAAALQRGTRLDEAIQGTGLGLAIVADLADLYGGSLELGQSDAGGLQATLVLTRQRGT